MKKSTNLWIGKDPKFLQVDSKDSDQTECVRHICDSIGCSLAKF